MPRALVTYGSVNRLARRASYAHPYGKYVRAGVRVYNTGRAFAPYAKAAISSFRSYRKRKAFANARKKKRVRYSLGNRIGHATAKRNEEEIGATATMNTKTLYSQRLIQIQRTGTTDDLEKRQRDIVNMRGVKICFWVRNTDSVNNKPMFFNWAIIVPKNDDSNSSTIATNDFFRGTGGQRSQTFATSLSFLDLRCLPINADKYRILHHKRMFITSDLNESNKGERLWEQYIPINRQIVFDSETDFPRKNLYMVWWCSNSTNSTTGALGEYRWRIVRYFKEPKN